MPFDQSRLTTEYLPWLTRQIINQSGAKVRHERGVKCPCLTRYDRPNPDCDLCRGHGYAYPGPGKLLKGLLSGMQASEQLLAAGLVQTGMMNFTPPAGTLLDDGDRVTLLEFPRRESLVLLRGESDRDVLYHLEPIKLLAAYRIVPNDRGEDTLDALPAASYRLDGRHVVWDLSKECPAHGSRYTAEYRFRPKYIVYRHDQPRYRGIQGKTLPQGVTLKFMWPSAQDAPA